MSIRNQKVGWNSIGNRVAPNCRQANFMEGKIQSKVSSAAVEICHGTLHHPNILEWVIVRYIKEVQHYAKEPILVAWDLQGKVVNQNAFYILRIWDNLAYPLH